MAVSEDKERVAISMPKTVVAKMDAYCKEAGLTRSGYISLLVSKDLDNTDVFMEEFERQIHELIERMEKVEGDKEKPKKKKVRL